MKILVTGASGLLGATFYLLAQENGHQVYPLYNNHKLDIFDNSTAHRIDLRQENAVISLLEEIRPDWVVHCAAITNVDYCESHQDESYFFHVLLSEILAKCALKASSRFIYISTDSVFDGMRGNYSELDKCNPINVYAQTKYLGELAVQKIIANALIVRTSIYGNNYQQKLSLSEWIVKELTNKNSITGFADVIFTPLLVDDLSEILLKLISKNSEGVYHIASSNAMSKLQFAIQLAEEFQLNKNLIKSGFLEDVALVAKRPKNTSLLSNKAEQFLGIKMPSIESGISKFKNLWEIRKNGINQAW